MNQAIASQIEDNFSRLSISDQLLLIERLIHHIHQSTLGKKEDLNNQLSLMAADPEIQAELQKIEQEFAHTEADGLEAL